MSYFYVYILKCKDGSYYVGQTDDIEKRVSEYQAGRYSGYTSTRLPIEVVFVQPFASRREALFAEYQIKKWGKKKREALIVGSWDKVRILSKKRF